MNLTALAGILSLAQSAFSVAEQYGSVAPKLLQGAESVLGSGRTVASDIGAIVSDIKDGKYADTEQGISKVMTDVGQLVTGVESALPAVAGLVAQTASLPSVSGLAAAVKAL